MSGIRREKLGRLICAGIATLALAGSAKATLINSESVVKDDIEYYIQTDKSVYDLGEDVEILYSITNLRDQKWRDVYLAPIRDVIVEEKHGEDLRGVWYWMWDKGYFPGPEIFELEAGESANITGVWAQIDLKGTIDIQDDVAVSVGTYRVCGVFRGTDMNIAVEVAIVPEPCSAALFLGCLVLMRQRAEQRRSAGKS